MEHLTEDELYMLAFDGAAVVTGAAAHLAGCNACRQALADLGVLAGELTIARRSQPSASAMQHYASLFAAIQRQPSRLQQAWQVVRAALAWDSRQQPALAGVRSAAAAGYRLLYTAPAAEIELLVEPSQGQRRIDGEVALEDGASAPALVQLLAADGAPQQETATDAFGRFHLGAVAPGAYTLLVTPAAGPALAVDGLELT
jgi:hypothetical protein